MRKQTQKKVTRTLKFIEITTPDGRFAGGGVGNSLKHLRDELWIDLFSEDGSRLEGDGKAELPLQFHLGGTRKAFEELGDFLLALSRYKPAGPGYSMSFDLGNSEGEYLAQLVVHLPAADAKKKNPFIYIHTVATAIIDKDGGVIDTTKKPRKALHSNSS